MDFPSFVFSKSRQDVFLKNFFLIKKKFFGSSIRVAGRNLINSCIFKLDDSMKEGIVRRLNPNLPLQ